MRHNQIITAILLALTISVFPACSKDLIPELAGRNDVERVYVSPAMIRMAGGLGDNDDYFDEEISGLLTGVRSLHVYECYSHDSFSIADDALKKYLNKHPDYEELLTNSNAGESTTIYGLPSKRAKDRCESIIIFTHVSRATCTIVFINAE